MKLVFRDTIEKFKIEICFLNLIILFFLFRTAIPFFKYPFLILYTGFLFYAILNYRKRIIPLFSTLLYHYFLVIILIGIMIFFYFFSVKFFLLVFKDILNSLIILSLFSFLILLIHSKKDLKLYIVNFIQQIIIFGVFISLLRVLDLLDIFHYTDFFSTYDSLNTDYNFALLPCFFGMIAIFFLLRKSNSKFRYISFNIILILFYFQIFLSGSRRGIMLLVILSLVLVIAIFINFLKKNDILKTFINNCKIFLVWLFIFPVLIYLFIFNTSYSFKSKILENIGVENGYVVKNKTSSNLFRFFSIFNNDLDVSKLYKKIWSVSFDPRDPENGWGEGNFKTVFPLTGTNVEIVPNGTKGYLQDKSARFGHSDLHAYTNTIIGNTKVKNGDEIHSSVYCFVSSDFNGSAVCLRSGGATFGNVDNCYDSSRKGVWQKLIISANCKNGVAPVYLYFNIQGVTDFSTLTGYVIFAYPLYRISNLNDSIYLHQIPGINDLKNVPGLQSSRQKEIWFKNYYSSFAELDSNSFPYAYSGHEVPGNLSAKDSPTKYVSFNKKLVYASILTLYYPKRTSGSIIQHDEDPIRNWFSKFISEDTTYHGYHSKIIIDSVSSRFMSERLLRWQFGFQLFIKEYKLSQKLVGGGFNFLNWYGYYFDKDKTRSDYPHNPFLSILLYSGILGLIVYLILMYKVFYYYVKYFKEYKILAVFFIITFFFSFFSAGSPFDPPMMGFFVILPFFIHSIHKKDELSKEISVLKDE